MARTLSIELVTDLVCPWCYIGAERLEQALAGFDPTVTVKLEHRPFLLQPDTPREGRDLRAYLKAKYGADPAAMFARVEAVARGNGLPMDFTKVTRACPTVAGHTLVRHAGPKGTQRELARALFRAYFAEGRDLGDESVLAAVASAHGFSEDEAIALCRDEAALQETRDEAREASAAGITGVPFYIFDGRLAVSGAQPVDVLRKVLARAVAEQASAGNDARA